VAADGDEIAAIASSRGLSGGDRVIDAEGKYVLPGAIDPHTHHGSTAARSRRRDGVAPDLVGGVTTIGNYFRRGGSYEEIMEGYFAEAEPNYYHDYFFLVGTALVRAHRGDSVHRRGVGDYVVQVVQELQRRRA